MDVYFRHVYLHLNFSGHRLLDLIIHAPHNIRICISFIPDNREFVRLSSIGSLVTGYV